MPRKKPKLTPKEGKLWQINPAELFRRTGAKGKQADAVVCEACSQPYAPKP